MSSTPHLAVYVYMYIYKKPIVSHLKPPPPPLTRSRPPLCVTIVLTLCLFLSFILLFFVVYCKLMVCRPWVRLNFSVKPMAAQL